MILDEKNKSTNEMYLVYYGATIEIREWNNALQFLLVLKQFEMRKELKINTIIDLPQSETK